MSVTSGSYGSVEKNHPPAGLKILCGILGGLNVLSFFAIILFFPSVFPGNAALVGILVGFILTVLNLALLIGLYKLNRIAYIIYVFLTGANLLFSLISLDILGIVLQGLIFGYLLSINDYF